MNLKELFNKPKIIAIISDVNQGKSMTLYHLLSELKKKFNFNLFSYGLRTDLGERKIYSIEELEQIDENR